MIKQSNIEEVEDQRKEDIEKDASLFDSKEEDAGSEVCRVLIRWFEARVSKAKAITLLGRRNVKLNLHRTSPLTYTAIQQPLTFINNPQAACSPASSLLQARHHNSTKTTPISTNLLRHSTISTPRSITLQPQPDSSPHQQHRPATQQQQNHTNNSLLHCTTARDMKSLAAPSIRNNSLHCTINTQQQPRFSSPRSTAAAPAVPSNVAPTVNFEAEVQGFSSQQFRARDAFHDAPAALPPRQRLYP